MPQAYTQGDEPVPGSGYRLVGFLGRGGFGEVWKASAPGGAEVAVKIIKLGGLQGRKEFRALQLVKRVRHPNLVPLIAFWLKSADGSVLDDELTTRPDLLAETASLSAPVGAATAVPRQFDQTKPTELIIVMGLGDKSLFDRLEECHQDGLDGIPQEELLHYMEDAARAIDFLNGPVHELGSGPAAIQHCDIKPHNIMIVGDATQVCDFGLARMMGADRTTTAAATMAYAAPECLQDGKPSDSTDQYSLAVTYYELRTGRLPYREETHVAVMNAKLEGNLDFSGVSGDEEVVLRRATATDPHERYPSALEMVKRLRSAIEGGGVVSPRPGGGVLGRLITTILIVAVLGAGGYYGWRHFISPPVPKPEPKPSPPEPPPNPPVNVVADLMAQASRREEAGQFESAVDAYTDVLRIEPKRAEAYSRRGRCYLKLEDYDAALSDLQRAKALDAKQYDTDPELTEAYAGRAKRFLESQDYDRAIADLQRAEGLDPGHYVADLGKAYAARGKQFLDQGKYDGAYSDLTEALKHNPQDGATLSRRGTIRFLRNDLEGALEDFTAAIEVDRHDSDYVRRGRVLHKLNRLDEAIADFQEAGRLNPQNAEAKYRLAVCYLEKEDATGGLDAINAAIELANKTPDPSFALADAYAVRGLCHMLAERFDEAAADLTQAIRLSQNDVASLHESRAECYQRLGRPEAAEFDRRIVACLRLIELDPGSPGAHNELAWYLATSNEPDIRDGARAIEQATQACESTSWQEPLYLDTLAAAYAEAGQFDQAIQWAEKAIELAPEEEARKRYQAGLGLYREGKPSRFRLQP